MQKKLRTIEGFGAGVHDPGGEVHPPDSLCAEDGEAIGESTGIETLRRWRLEEAWSPGEIVSTHDIVGFFLGFIMMPQIGIRHN